MSKIEEARNLLQRSELPFTVKVSDDNKLIIAKLMFGSQDNVFVVQSDPDDQLYLDDQLYITGYPISVNISTNNGIHCSYSVSQVAVVIHNLQELATRAVETAKVAQTYLDTYTWCSRFRRSLKEQNNG